MKRHDILLLVSASCLVAAGALVAYPLGLLVAGLVFAALWFLLGDA